MGSIQAWCTKAYRQLVKRLPQHLRDGNRAESRAQRYLEKQGLSLVASNFHSKFGEIDLIMLEGEVLVFVEVRLRADNRAIESVTTEKQRKILATANFFLSKHPLYMTLANRFDIIGMQNTRGGEIEWIQHAIEAR